MSSYRLPQRMVVRTVALLLFALALFTFTYQIPQRYSADIGSTGDDKLINGFYFAEGEGDNTFRWSSGQASIAFPGVGQRDWMLHLRMSGLRPSGSITASLSLNEQQPLGALQLGGEMAEYSLPIARDQMGTSGDVRLLIAAPIFNSPPDTRALGVMVDWAELRPVGWQFTLPAWLMVGQLFLIVLLVALLGERLQLSPRRWWILSLLTTGAAAWVIGTDLLWLRTYLWWFVGLALLLWLLGGWLRGARWWEWLLLAVVMLALYRFGLRVIDHIQTALPPVDFSIYFSAAQNLWQGLPIYDFKAASEMPNGPVYKYPPLVAILLAPFSTYAANTVAAGWLIINLALYLTIFFLLVDESKRFFFIPTQRVPARHPHPEGTRPSSHRLFALLTALLFLNFQPAWESLIRGQLDILILCASLIGLRLYNQHRHEWLGGALLAFVSMTKIYPAVLWLFLLGWRRWGAIVGFVITGLLLTVFSGIIVGWDVLWRYVSEVLTVQTAAVPWPENQSWSGLLARLIIPVDATTWYTTIPFPQWMRWLHYAVVLVTLLLTVFVFWRRRRSSPQAQPQQGNQRVTDLSETYRFTSGYFATLLLMVMVWPTSWIHYETLLLPGLALMIAQQLSVAWRDKSVGDWLRALLLVVSLLLLAIGNEYTVLTPELHVDSWPRLLQSYKFYGMVLLWMVMAIEHRTVWYRLQNSEIGGDVATHQSSRLPEKGIAFQHFNRP